MLSHVAMSSSQKAKSATARRDITTKMTVNRRPFPLLLLSADEGDDELRNPAWVRGETLDDTSSSDSSISSINASFGNIFNSSQILQSTFMHTTG
mmetsp:Transcript_24884/g.45067  ORF Transcript_24884/g.45067 Transcript_24884/m.45067 type:complete len:95 (+) Transcript_24884:2744-3028(+)